MRKHLLPSMVAMLLVALPLSAEVDLQLYYDFGSTGTACANQRTNRVTTTIEMFHPDNWGSTYFFFDMDYSLNKANYEDAKDPRNCPFGTYWEITRCLNFWQNTAAKDLSLHVEYDGGLGIYSGGVATGGYGINHAALVGADYFLHTADYKNTFTLQLLFKYIADDYNMYRVKRGGNWQSQSGNLVPLQFTFVWACQDFCTAPGLSFSGFLDVWGQKQSVFDRKNNIYTDPNEQSFVIISEPQLWYCIGQHFKCPNLHIGTEIELSYNFTGKGFMCNPCIGFKWRFL